MCDLLSFQPSTEALLPSSPTYLHNNKFRIELAKPNFPFHIPNASSSIINVVVVDIVVVIIAFIITIVIIVGIFCFILIFQNIHYSTYVRFGSSLF